MTRETINHPIAYRPPKDRRSEFDAMVAESGLSRSAFITECVFGRSRVRPAETRLAAKQLRELARIADLIRDLRLSGNTELLPALDEIVHRLSVQRSLQMSNLDRRS